MTNDELGALLLEVHGGVKGTAALLESVRHEVERQGKAIGVLVRRTNVLEYRQTGVAPPPEDPPEGPPEGANEPHDTAVPPEPGSPADVAALIERLPPMRAPAVSLNSEVRATHDSLRVMATAAKESLPILAATAVSATEAATSSAAAASSSAAGTAETVKQTPILMDAAKSAAKSVTTAQITGLANFLAILIVGIAVSASQRCTPPAPAPPGYVMVPATAVLPRAPAPTATPAPR